MKHVFIITNNLNKKLSDKYIETSGIPSEEIVFVGTTAQTCGISDDNLFFVKNNIKQINTSSFSRLLYTATVFSFFTKNKANKKIAEIVRGEYFHLYIPHSYLFHFLLFYNHPKCKKVSIVEEGDAAYINERMKDSQGLIEAGKKPIARLVYWLLGLNDKWHIVSSFPPESKIDSVICLSNNAFPFYSSSKKTIIKFEELYKSSQEYEGMPNILILVDSLFKYGKYTEEDYLMGLDLFIKHRFLGSNDKNVLVSYHPTIRGEKCFIKRVEDVFAKYGITQQEFNRSVEGYLVSTHNPIVYGIISSSMRYALMTDARVFSWLNYIPPGKVKNREELYSYYKDIGVELV